METRRKAEASQEETAHMDGRGCDRKRGMSVSEIGFLFLQAVTGEVIVASGRDVGRCQSPGGRRTLDTHSQTFSQPPLGGVKTSENVSGLLLVFERDRKSFRGPVTKAKLVVLGETAATER